MTTKANQKSKTHFEQIPLEEVKTVIAGEVRKEHKTGTGNPVSKPVSKETKPYFVLPDSPSRERR
jgi:hypothetical protein